MPTRFTHAAGTAAYVAALAWVLTVPAAIVRSGEPYSDAQVRAYFVWAVLVSVAAIASVIAIVGLLRRSGGAWDPLTVAALVLAVLGAFAASLFTWGWPVGLGLLAIASLLAVIRMHAARLGLGAADWLLVAAWPLAIAVEVVVDRLRVGAIDEYGDSVTADLVGFTIGAMLFALGLALSGRWLRAEATLASADARLA